MFSGLPAGARSAEVLDIDPSGKVLALAEITNTQRELIRFLADGTPDPAFTEPTALGGRTRSAAFLSDGTIIAAGFYSIGGESESAVRLLADGSLDATFSLETDDTLTTEEIHVISGDRFWLAGQFFNDLLEGSFVAIHNADGSLIERPFINREADLKASLTKPDGSLVFALRFNGERTLHRTNSDGTTAPPPSTAFPAMQFLGDLALAPDGSYVAGGHLRDWPRPDITHLYRSAPTPGTSDIALAPASTGAISELRIDGAGRILATGLSTYGAIDLSVKPLARLLDDGALDLNFDASLPGLGAAVDKVTSFRIAGDGKIVCGLELADGSASIVRLNGGDPSPSPPGIIYQTPATPARLYQDLQLEVWATGFPAPAVQWRKDGVDIPGATGNVLLIGPVAATDAAVYTAVLTNASGSTSSAPITISADPPEPGDIDTRSLSALEAGSLSQLIPLPDGRLLARGSVRSGGQHRQLLQLEPDGSIDPSFRAASLDTPGASAFFTDVMPARDGSILVTYELSDDAGFETRYPVARLNSDGTFAATLNVPDFAPTSFLQALDDGSFLAENDFNPRWFSAGGGHIAFTDYATSYHRSAAGAPLVYAGQTGDYPTGPGLYELDGTGDRDAASHIPLPEGMEHLRILPDRSIRALRKVGGSWRIANFAADGTPAGDLDTGLETVLAAAFDDSGNALVYGTRTSGAATVHEVVRAAADLGSSQVVEQTGDITEVTPSGFVFAPDGSIYAWGNLPPIAGFRSVGFARFHTGLQAPGPPTFSLVPFSPTIDAGEPIHLRAVSHSWPRPAFQWFRDGVAIPGATRPALYLPQTDFSDTAAYSVSLSNEQGTLTSPTAYAFVAGGFEFLARQSSGLNRFQLATVPGRRYQFERTPDLLPSSWSVLETFDGDGGVRELSDDAPGIPVRFYRATVDRDPPPE